jgi:hypothetical protein
MRTSCRMAGKERRPPEDSLFPAGGPRYLLLADWGTMVTSIDDSMS